MLPIKNRFVVEVKKLKQEKLGATIVLEIQGVRIDAITPGGVLDKTKKFQLRDRIVNINGEDMTRKEVMETKLHDDVAKLFNATLAQYSPDITFTVSRFDGAMLEAAKKDRAKDIAAKEISGQKEIKDIEAAVKESKKKGTVFEKDGKQMSLSECPEVGFIVDLGELAVEILAEAKKMFEKRGRMNKWLYATTYKDTLKKFQDALNGYVFSELVNCYDKS